MSCKASCQEPHTDPSGDGGHRLGSLSGDAEGSQIGIIDGLQRGNPSWDARILFLESRHNFIRGHQFGQEGLGQTVGFRPGH